MAASAARSKEPDTRGDARVGEGFAKAKKIASAVANARANVDFTVRLSLYHKIRYIHSVVKGSRLRFPRMVCFLALAALFLVASGCSRGFGRSFTLPPDPAFSSDIGWAVVVTSYAEVKRAPVADSEDLALARKGTVFEIRERRIDPSGMSSGGLWYRIGESSYSGWISDQDLSVHPSEYQARSFARSLDSTP